MHRGLLATVTACTAVLIAGFAADRASAAETGACALLNPADIAKATGLTVATGTPGPAMPGVLGKSSWAADGGAKVIVTVVDNEHMQQTVAAQEKNGGTAVPGLGQKAVATAAAPFMGGGYIVSVLDAKGSFGVSVLGKEGTRDGAVALAKLAESRR